MKESAFDPGLVPLNPFDPECILTKWLISVVEFRKYYLQLVACFNQIRFEPNLNVVNTAYLGQCPINLLACLMSTMEQELKNLSQDFDQLAEYGPLSTAKNYQKLRIHTLVLNQLNQQAQHRLYLVNLSSS